MKCIKKTLLSLSAALLITSCATKAPPPPGNNHLDAGWYIFDCDAIYKEGLCQVSKIAQGYKVNLVESFAGDLELHTTSVRNEVQFKNPNVDYGELKRTLSGEGYMMGANTAQGTATSWIKRSRHHRENRPWTLRPATEREVQKVLLRLKARGQAIE
ncbi:MAG: hypothetical protein ACI9TH_001952 [Kiritimatiellia bacterium]|jgi:hypothetical protein